MRNAIEKTKEQKVKDIQEIINRNVRGVWIAAHDKYGHHYKHRDLGIVVDSVTTKLILEKEHLVPWAAEIAVRDFLKNIEFYDAKNTEQTDRMIEQAKYAFRAVRDDAGNIGTKSHDVFEHYVNIWIETGVRPPDIKALIPEGSDPRVFATTRSAEKFFNDYDGEIIPIAAELLVGDPETGTTGTLDLLVLWNGMLWLLDWKSSNSAVHDDYVLQVSAYGKLLEKMTGLKVKGLSIIGVSKGYDKYVLLDIPRPGEAFRVFKGVSRAYDWIEDGKPKMIERKNRLILK